MCISAVGGERRLPRIRLVDPRRRAVRLEQQVLGPGRVAERHAAQRLPRRHRPCPPASAPAATAAGTAPCSATTPGVSMRAQQHLQHVDARGRCGSRSNAPRCRASRASPPAGRSSSRAAARPSRSTAGRSTISCSNAACASSAAMPPDRRGRHAAALARPHPARSAGRGSARPPAGTPAPPCRPSASSTSPTIAGDASAASAFTAALRLPSQHSGRPSPSRANSPSSASPGALHHQPRRVGVARQEIEIDLVGAQQLVDQRHHQQPVRARPDRRPTRRRPPSSRSAPG